MNEEDLILELLGIEKKAELLNIEKHYDLNAKDLEIIEQEIAKTNSKHESTIADLNEFENAKTSQIIREKIISTFAQIRISKSNKYFGLFVSKSQSMINDEWHIGKILIEINKIINLDFSGFSKPFLNLTDEDKDGVEIEAYNKFLENEIEIISGISLLNYNKLRIYFKEFHQRLNDLK